MFEINPKTKDVILTQGNAGIISVVPYISGSDSPFELAEYDKILFTVTSPSKKVYIQKEYGQADINEDGSVDVKITSKDTLEMSPFRYKYDVLLAQYNNQTNSYEGYTFINTAYFTITEAQGLTSHISLPETTPKLDEDENTEEPTTPNGDNTLEDTEGDND